MIQPISFRARRKIFIKPLTATCGLPAETTFKNGIQEMRSINSRKPSPLCSIFEEFTSATTLHGFRFLLNRKYSRIERVWWAVMVICSITVGSYLISNIWYDWNKSPVVLNIIDLSSSTLQIPFPAVTICTETKTRQTMFNFTKALNKRWRDISSISTKDFKLYNDLLLVCHNPYGDGPEFADISSVETLRKSYNILVSHQIVCDKLAPTREETFLRCKWGNFSCRDLFSRILTREGYCFTFNLIATEQMFRTENLHNDYLHTECQNKSNWSLEKGYEPTASLYTYPFRGLMRDFDLTLLTDLRDVDHQCRGPVQGFKIWLHNPTELPDLSQKFIRIPIKYHSNVMIKSRLTVTSANLRRYTTKQRRCYFTDERYLRYFRIYTEKNCREECDSNYTAKRCNCVPPYMPHDLNTKICGGGKAECVMKALEELSLTHSGHDVKMKKIGVNCGCLQSCTELKYTSEVSQAVFNIRAFEIVYNLSVSKQRYLPSGITIKFAREKTVALLRSELYLTTDFLAQCGGIMGLTIGFSILSLFEIFFHFTLRLWSLMKEQK